MRKWDNERADTTSIAADGTAAAIHGHVGPGIDGGVRRQRIGSRSYNNLHSSRRQERTTRLARRRRELVMIMGFFNCS